MSSINFQNLFRFDTVSDEVSFGNAANALSITSEGPGGFPDGIGIGTIATPATGLHLQFDGSHAQIRLDNTHVGGRDWSAFSSSNANTIGGGKFVISDNTADEPRLAIDGSGNARFYNNLTVSGDFYVNGATTTINSTTLAIDDKNIELGKGSGDEGNDAAMDGAGITVKSTNSDKTILWESATNMWHFNQNIGIEKAGATLFIGGTGTGDIWTSQGAKIRLGESAFNGSSAALNLTYVGDGYSYIGSGTIGATTGIPSAGYIKFHYNTNNLYIVGNVEFSSEADSTTFRGGVNIGNTSDTADADKWINFSDNNSSAWRSFGWDNGANKFMCEDNSSTMRTIIHSGNISSYANNYSHPTGAGNNHLPAGGDVGQILTNSAAGTAVWSAPTAAGGDGTVTSVTVTTAAGLDGGSTTITESGTIALSLDLNELSASGTLEGTDDLVVVDGALTRKTQISTVPLSIFNNDSGFITSYNNTMGTGFVMEDGDGTEVTITEDKEVKFVEGAGIDINWTNTSAGSDGNPYDLTFACNLEGTELKSTGQTGGSKFLREDGDGTCSWQTVSAGGGGDITGVTAGSGLSGGGNGPGAVTLAVGQGTGINVSSSMVSVDFSETSLTIGQLTGAGADDILTVNGKNGAGQSIIAAGDVIGMNNTSDDRLKTNINKINNALDKVASLEGFSFNWNDAAKEVGITGGEQVGLSAQTLEKVLPQVVKGLPNSDYKMVDYQKVVPLLVEAIKELKSEIEELKSK